MNMFAYIPLAHSFMKKLITNKNNFGSRQLLLSYLSLFLHLYVHSLEQRTVDGGEECLKGQDPDVYHLQSTRLVY